MGLFNKESKTYKVILNRGYDLPITVADYIDSLERKVNDLENELLCKTHELSAIKPIIKNGNLKPAISKYCHDCKFVVKSNYNSSIIGCCKDNICDDYKSIL